MYYINKFVILIKVVFNVYVLGKIMVLQSKLVLKVTILTSG